MPCKECENGKYKWGERGECKYDTLADCENANAKYSEQSKNTRIVELIIEDDNQELAIDAISLVSAPAIEQDFVFFGKEKHNLTFAKVDEEKRMLVSPALIPNKQIFRYDPNTDSEYYVYFSPATIRKASELYLKHNNHHKATYEHSDRVSGVLTTESWIKEGDSDKSKMYGYDLPNGTWFVKMKIENDELWSKIKEGELRGLSIEGYFIDKMQKMSEKQPTDLEILSALNELFKDGKLSKLSKVERKAIAKKVELQDVKTLDKLESKAYAIYDAMPDANDIEMSIDQIDNWQSDIVFSQEKLEEAKEEADEYKEDIAFYKEELKGIKPRIKSDEAGLKEANKKIKTRLAEIKTATKEKVNAQKKATTILKEATKQVANAKKVASQLAKGIKDFEKAAKALGVNASSKVNEYITALKDVQDVAGFKVPKIK